MLKKTKNMKRLLRNDGKWGARFTKLAIYLLLLDFGFVYIYPVIYMVLVSLMPTSDLINPTIQWIPTHLDVENFKQVYNALEYGPTFTNTVIIAGTASVLQTLSCALAGYGLAKFRVPLKKFWIGMLILVFVVPTGLTMVPQYVLFNNYKLVGSPLSIWLPAAFGQGVKSSLFVLIFMQGFSYPKAYDEAAQIDGAGSIRRFFQIAVPMVVPTIILSLLLSFVWYWNETARASMYLDGQIMTLPLQLDKFNSLFGNAYPASAGSSLNRLNERIQMAATLLTVGPLMILYLIMQKKFVEGVEASGITGE